MKRVAISLMRLIDSICTTSCFKFSEIRALLSFDTFVSLSPVTHSTNRSMYFAANGKIPQVTLLFVSLFYCHFVFIVFLSNIRISTDLRSFVQNGVIA